MKKHRTRIGLVAAALLSACSMAPQYERPPLPVAASWPEAAEPAGQLAANVAWRDYFVEPSLAALIELALANNRDLRVAALNIEKARAMYQIQGAAQLPAINAVGSETAQRTPAALTGTGHERISRQFSLSVGIASYELDFFGRVQSLKDQMLEQYLATEEAQQSARISLIAEVASAYLSTSADKERLELAQSTLASQQASLALVKRKYQIGVASALDLAQAQSGFESARAEVARYRTLVAQGQNALTLVVGGKGISAEAMPEQLGERSLSGTRALLAGTPSEVLLSRPDVRQAEHQLRAANANIGAARAAFFPRISLTASTGFASPGLGDLFQGDARTWSFIPQISLPLFNGGLNTANLEVAKLDREIRVAQYEKAIQSAFREVADALTQRANVSEQLSAQAALTGAVVEAHRLTQLRYEKGVASYLNVLDAQRAMYAAQQGLITMRQARQANMIGLYKVLGGGSVRPAG
jgi:multidrug efflux system outer membrane protein